MVVSVLAGAAGPGRVVIVVIVVILMIVIAMVLAKFGVRSNVWVSLVSRGDAAVVNVAAVMALVVIHMVEEHLMLA